MINRFVGVGRMVADPELTFTPSGVAKCTFTLAINRPFSNQQGEKEADFIRIECWRKVAENVANFTRKGSLVGIDGSVRTGSYDGQDGKRVYFTNINADSVQFLDSKGDGGQGQTQQNNSGYQQQNAPQTQYQQPQQQYQAPQQQQQQSYQQSSQQYQQPPQQTQPQYGQQQQQNYSRVDEDPFANSKGPINVDEDSLPF